MARMVVMMHLLVLPMLVLPMDRIGIRPVGFLRNRWRVDRLVWLAPMVERLLMVPNRVSVGLPPVWRRVSRCVVVGLMVWLAVPLVTELLVRVVSALLEQMVLVLPVRTV